MRLAPISSPCLILLCVGPGNALPRGSSDDARVNVGAALKNVALHASYIVPSAAAILLGLRLARAEADVAWATKQGQRADTKLGGLSSVVSDNAKRLQSDVASVRQLLRTAGNDADALRKVDALLDKLEHGLRQTGGGGEYSVLDWIAPDDMDADIEDCVRRLEKPSVSSLLFASSTTDPFLAAQIILGDAPMISFAIFANAQFCHTPDRQNKDLLTAGAYMGRVCSCAATKSTP
jgi:hypothetical protein